MALYNLQALCTVFTELDKAVEDGALSSAVAAAEHVDIWTHVPNDVLVAAP